MAEYISREDAVADVAPVRHGRWILKNKVYGDYECSVCHGMDSNCTGCYSDHYAAKQNFCPNCGAKMDGGANDETNG